MHYLSKTTELQLQVPVSSLYAVLRIDTTSVIKSKLSSWQEMYDKSSK